MRLKNRKILVTGATGFIGTNIARRLLVEGSNVSIFVRRESDKWRIKDILRDVRVYTVDLKHESEIRKAVNRIRPEIVVHTAVHGGYPFQKDIRKMFAVNIIGTMNLLNVCKDKGFSFFLNTGSSSEYGIKNRRMKESDILEPAADYGVSKASATLYCQSLAKKEKLPIATLRLFSPYGYFEDSSRLIPYVILSCLKKKSIKLSSPYNVRDFVFIDDVTDIYVKAIERKDAIAGEVLNVGSGREHSVGDTVKKILDLIETQTRLEWGDTSNSHPEPKMWQADISKAKRLLGWTPKHGLDKGLEKTIKWFRKNKNLY